MNSQDPLRYRDRIIVGTLVVANKSTRICKKGERGICFDVYDFGKTDFEGYSIIFQDGGYEGFSANEVERTLKILDRVDPVIANYTYANAKQLMLDYKIGIFNSAWTKPKLRVIDGGKPPT